MVTPVALVTGGTRGIGLGIARALSARGCDLVLCGVRPPSQVAEVMGEFERAGRRVQYVAADISRAADRETLVGQAIDQFGRIDILVNNAGRAPRVRTDLLEADEASFDEVMAANLRGPYFLTQRVARLMLDQLERGSDATGRQAIVFVTSISATAASPNRGEYCVSKAGLSMAVKLFATRLAPRGIPVFEVRPGIIDTDMTAAVRDVYDQRIANGLVPAARWGMPADVGQAVAALVCPPLAYATGSVIDVGGGLQVERL